MRRGDINRFSSGYTPEGVYTYMVDIHNWVKAFTALPMPTIAAVNGYATGAGLCLALFCDTILAAPQARFGSAFLDVGIIPDLAALYCLLRLMGLQRAKEFVIAGEILTAEQACEWRLVNRVTPEGALLDEAKALAGKMMGTSRFALQAAKRLLNTGMDSTRDGLLNAEAYTQALCFQGQDFAEGIRAFQEKRPPAFKS